MTTYSDDFTRANNTNISTGAPNPLTEVEDNSEILSNALHAVNVGGATLTTVRVEQDITANQTVSCTIRSPVASASANELSLGVAIRYSASAATYYAVMADCQNVSLGTATILIKKSIAGVYTNISTGTPISMADGDVLTANIQNNTITVFYNGVQKLQITDSSITTGNRAGAAMYRAATAADGSVDNLSIAPLPVRATPTFVCGAECGLATVGTAGVGLEHWSAASNSPVVVTSGPSPMLSARCFSFPNGAYLEHTPSASIAATTAIVTRFKVYVTAFPTSGASAFFHCNSGTTPAYRFYFGNDGTNNTIGPDPTGVGSVAAGTAIIANANQWYTVDIRFVPNSGTVEWQIDGVAKNTYSLGNNGAAITTFRIGNQNISGVGTPTCYMDDICISLTEADFPIGSGTVVGLYPNGDGTHLYAAGADFGKSGTSLTSLNATSSLETTSWQSLTNPLSTTIDTTKFISDQAGPSNEYLEWTFDDLPAGNLAINGLMVVTTNHASGTAGATITGRLNDGGTTSDLYNLADFSEATIVSAVGAFATAPSSSIAWTKAQVNTLKFQWGLSTDVNPDPILDGVMFEVDYIPAVAVSVPTRRLAYSTGMYAQRIPTTIVVSTNASAGLATATAVAYNTLTLDANAVFVILSALLPPPPPVFARVIPGLNPSQVETVPVPVFIFVMNIPQPPPPAPGVILGQSPGIVETVPMAFITCTPPPPPFVQLVGVMPGRAPPSFQAAPTVNYIQSTNIPRPLQAVQVIPSVTPPVTAIGFLHKDTRANNGGNATFSTAAITIGNGNLALISISQAISAVGSHPVRPSLPSGSGITNVAFVAEIITFDPGGNDDRSLHLFSAIGNGTSAVISYNFPTTPNNSNCGVDEVTGGPTVVQQSSTAFGTSGTLTGTPLAALQSGSATFACFACNDGQTSTMTPRAGWTELHDDLGATGTTISLERQYKVAGDTASSATLDSQVGTPRWGVIAVEIAVGASASAGVASGTGSALNAAVSIAPNAGNAAGSGAALDAATLRANAVFVVLATPPPPPPATRVQVISGWNPSRVETVPVPDLVQAQAIQQPLTPVRVYPSVFTSTSGSANPAVASGTGAANDATISIVEYIATDPPSATGTAYDASTITASAVHITVQAPIIPPPPVTVRVVSGLPASSVETVPIPRTVQVDAIRQQVQTVQVIRGTSPGAVSANAGVASGTGSANNAAASVSGSSGTATSSGAAGAPSASDAPNAGNAASTGTANNASAITANADFVLIAAPLIPPPPISVRVLSVVIPVVSANAGAATGTGTANNPAANVQPNSALATGSGASFGAAGSVAGTSGNASGTGAANGAAAADAVNAGLAAATGAGSNATAITASAVFIRVIAPLIPPPAIAVKVIPALDPSRVETVPVPDLIAVQAIPVPTQPVRVLSVFIPPAGVAAAGIATGTGTAYATTTSIAPTSGAGSGAGSAGDIAASVSGTSGTATGSGTSGAPTASDSPNAGNATATGTSNDPAPSVTVQAGLATGTGVANNASALTILLQVPLPYARGVYGHRFGSFQTPPGTSALSITASGTGSAFDATCLTANAVFVTIATPAQAISQPLTQVAVIAGIAPTAGSANAGLASGTGTANDAAVSVAGSSGSASGTGSPGSPAPAVAVNAGVATGAVVASNATAVTASAAFVLIKAPSIPLAVAAVKILSVVIPSTSANAGVALGSGVVSNAKASIAVSAGLATGGGQANDATASTSSSGSSTPGAASGTGAANNAKVDIGASGITAAVSGSANGISTSISGTSGTASGSGTSDNPTPSDAANAASAAANGSADDGAPSISVNAGVAQGTALAYDATTVRLSTLTLIKSPTRVTVEDGRTYATITSNGLTRAELSNSGANSLRIEINGKTVGNTS